MVTTVLGKAPTIEGIAAGDPALDPPQALVNIAIAGATLAALARRALPVAPWRTPSDQIVKIGARDAARSRPARQRKSRNTGSATLARSAGRYGGADIVRAWMTRSSGWPVSSIAQRRPRWAWEGDLIAAAGTPLHLAVQRPFSSAEEVVDLLAGAGFEDVRVYREETDINFPSEQDWWDWHWSFSLRGVLEQFDPRARDALRTASFQRMAHLRSSDGFPVHLNAWIVTARRAASLNRVR